MKYEYPKARRGDVVDEYHGVKVPDPYRWLEDPDSPETRAWIEAENRLTFSYLERIPEREAIRRRLETLWNYEKYGVPVKKGGRYFYEYNPGLLNQNRLYVLEGAGAEPRLLLDPNTFSEDGTVALTYWTPSEDGKRIAYAISRAGSDWKEWHVLDVETGKVLPDVIRWSKFSGASWSPDGSGFYYSAYDPPQEDEALTGQNYFQKLYFHRVGTEQAEDRLVYERPDEKEWGFDGRVTDDGRYLVIHVWRGTEPKTQVFYQSLERPGAPVVELLTGFDAEYEVIESRGDMLYVKTDLEAPRGRIVAIDLKRPKREAWREVVPEQADTLQVARLIGGRLVLEYLRDAKSALVVYGLDGKRLGEVSLPGIGSVAGLSGDPDDSEAFFLFTGYTTPTEVMRLDVERLEAKVYRRPRVDFDPDAFETRQVFVRSKDGTKVPMFITHRKGLKLDGDNPTLLYGYGGFGISLTPTFSVSMTVWMEMGGVYAVANLRGGGEYGEAWHQAGTKLKKQNVFDDFIAAAEWLIDHRYTRPERLAIMGGSNGGLLVGAVLTQRPDLFGAAVVKVGVLDMLRYHRFTIGWAWASDYGTVENEDEFKALLAYSPLHNVREGTKYPATLITTADHDDRVVPAHSFKFAAALQHAQAGPDPILIRIETKAGHGAGKPTQKIIDEVADTFAFLVHELGIEGVAERWPTPKETHDGSQAP
ncbi:MAG: S9 family peptidase [Deltaproteobacteria bacterium]|nr:MAG: S9 family peptidase [Deltaproteobacteria bacterium]